MPETVARIAQHSDLVHALDHLQGTPLVLDDHELHHGAALHLLWSIAEDHAGRLTDTQKTPLGIDGAQQIQGVIHDLLIERMQLRLALQIGAQRAGQPA